MRTLTRDELQALREYAQRHGRTWKASLRLAWIDASEPGILHALRNDRGFGPAGLNAFKFPEEGE